MNRLTSKVNNQIRRKNRVRRNIFGTSDRPRLSVLISGTSVSAQIINDDSGTTLVQVNSFNTKDKQTMTAKAESAGAEIAKAAKTKKIKKVVFDRNGRVYHGRLKAFAEAARKEGLEF